jgi:hypothetical protein
MGGVPLVPVIPDGDSAMKIAINIIFPNAFQSWRLFSLKRRHKRK